MSSPADTIRAALDHGNTSTGVDAALAALTELEQQLAAVTERPDSAVTDLETTALEALDFTKGVTGLEQREAAVAAVRELARRADEDGRELRRWLAWSNGQYPDDCRGDVIAADTDGTLTLDDSITTWNPLRAAEFFYARAEAAEADRDRWRNKWEEANVSATAYRADRDRLQVERYRYREALEQIACSYSEGCVENIARAALATPDTPEPTGPGDVTSAPDGECNGCKWGWERYQNPQGIWLHRNATDTVGAICTATPDTPPDA